MKKILFFYRIDEIKPIGGPAGYLYNLNEGIKNLNDENYQFYFLPSSNENLKVRNCYNKLPLLIKKIIRTIRRSNARKKINTPITLPIDFNINQFDVIHFHSCMSLYQNISLLKDYTGRIILTTHCPKPPHKEIVEDFYSSLDRFLYGKKNIKVFEKAVRESFYFANYIIFPCKEAEEPYYNNWQEYSQIHNDNQKKYLYSTTGAKSCLEKIKLSKTEIRRKFNIPEDSFVVVFVGRHNFVKGYDLLKKISGHFSKNKNIFFLIAGAETPLTRPINNTNWIEVGWTNDPYSIINAGDIFILPNKETYFDLVLIEALSIGIPLLISNTGGNKHYKKYKGNIFLFENEEEAVEKIKKLQNESFDWEINRSLYRNYFSENTFAQNYMKLLEGIFK